MKNRAIPLVLPELFYRLKTIFYLFSLLIIYTSIFSSVYGQNIYLNLTGKDSIENSVLKNVPHDTVFKNIKELKDVLSIVEKELQKRGYLETELIDLIQKNDSLYEARFHLKDRIEKIKVYFGDQGKRNLWTAKELRTVADEVYEDSIIIDLSAVEETLSYLNRLLSEREDPFARLRLLNIRPSRNDKAILEADLKVSAEGQRMVTGIEIKGYEKFRKPFLTYAAGIKEGMLFQENKIAEKSSLLNNLGFVTTLRSPEILFTPEETVVYLYLEKKNNNFFDGILGFATNEATGNLELNGYLHLELSNNLNFGESLSIDYRNDGKEQEQFKAKVILPYIMKTPFGIEAELNLFKRDTTFLTVEKQLLAQYQATTKTILYGGYKDYESSNLLSEQPAGLPVEDYKAVFGTVGIRYINPQASRLFRNKTFANLQNEIGNRKALDGNTSQYRLKMAAGHILNLNFRNSFFLKNTTHFLLSDNFLQNELFRFGGINSIRGFAENLLEASFYSVLNTEYRYLLNRDAYLHSIIDFAYFENKVIDVKRQLYSFGIGIALNTKAGIFHLNVANGKQEQEVFRFSNTKIHLSLSSRF